MRIRHTITLSMERNILSILMMTGANDGRVAPYHSRKMVARLDEANKSQNPILLRTSSSAGHGIGTALRRTNQTIGRHLRISFCATGNDGQGRVIG